MILHFNILYPQVQTNTLQFPPKNIQGKQEHKEHIDFYSSNDNDGLQLYDNCDNMSNMSLPLSSNYDFTNAYINVPCDRDETHFNNQLILIHV